MNDLDIVLFSYEDLQHQLLYTDYARWRGIFDRVVELRPDLAAIQAAKWVSANAHVGHQADRSVFEHWGFRFDGPYVVAWVLPGRPHE